MRQASQNWIAKTGRNALYNAFNHAAAGILCFHAGLQIVHGKLMGNGIRHAGLVRKDQFFLKALRGNGNGADGSGISKNLNAKLI